MNKIAFIVLGFGLLAGICQAGLQGMLDSGYIEVDNGKIYYELSGSGKEAVIFIHDGLVHSAIWDNQFSIFAEKFRVVRYDRRGYGRSPKPEKPYSNIEDLHSVLAFLNVEKAVLIGMSAGGALVLDFTLKYPQKVSAIILVGAVVGGFSYSEHFLTRGGRLQASDFADLDKLLAYFVKEDPYEIAPQNKEIKEKLWELMQHYPQNMGREKSRLAIPPRPPALEILNQIAVPALIMAGEFDIPDVFAHAGAIESGIAHSRKVIIKDAGHLVPLEQPDRFNTEVFSFLDNAEFSQLLNSGRVAKAAELFQQKRQENKDWTPFSEPQMNTLGYQYLQSGKIKEAIELFKLNVMAFPQSANTYDSLGEAYMLNGDKDLAIENYTRSLQLDPNNNNAAEKLEELNQ